MKLVLVNPPNIINGNINIPLGLIILENIFKSNNIDTEIVDLNFIINSKGISLNQCTYSELSEIILEKDPQIIGITSMSNNYINSIILAKTIKEKKSNCKIFMGGPQASFVDIETLEVFKFIDFIVRGESELVVPYLSRYFLGYISISDIPNVTYRKDKNIIRNNKNFQLIEGKDLISINYDKYFKDHNINNIEKLLFPIEVGRGCPFNCTFCSTSVYWNRLFRLKPIDKIIKEMNTLNKKYNVKTFNLMHDMFTCNKKLVFEFIKKVKNLKYIWTCSSRIDVLDFELLKKMKESGCKNIFFGIESGDLLIQKNINKNLNLDKAEEILKHCKMLGINTTVSFIIGFPKENKLNIENTLKKLLSFRIQNLFSNYIINIIIPEHGSILYKINKEALYFDEVLFNLNPNRISIDKELELKLIKDYPVLFNAFYSIKSYNFNGYFLVAIKKVFSFLFKWFRYTVYYIVKKKQINIIDLISSIMKWNDDMFLNESQLSYAVNNNYIVYNLSSKLIDDVAKDLFIYEKSILEIKTDKIYKSLYCCILKDNKYLFKSNYKIEYIIKGLKCNLFTFRKNKAFYVISKEKLGRIKIEFIDKYKYDSLIYS